MKFEMPDTRVANFLVQNMTDFILKNFALKNPVRVNLESLKNQGVRVNIRFTIYEKGRRLRDQTQSKADCADDIS